MAREPINPSRINNQRTLIIAGGVIVIIFLGFIIWILYFQPEPEPVATNTTLNENVPIINTAPPTNTTPVVTEPEAPEILEMRRVAQFFGERYGSYSTDADFANITNLAPYMTDSMQSVADSFIAAQSNVAATGYQEVVSKVITTEVETQTNTAATVRLTLQRVESGDDVTGNNVYYEDLVLDMVQRDGTWLVDNAVWEDTDIGAAPDITPEEDAADYELFDLFSADNPNQ